jgi:hypothetical protein
MSIFFVKVIPRLFKCFAKLLRRSVEKPWLRYWYSLKKWQENKMEERKVFTEPLGGVDIFQGPVENLLRV